ncbi:hypothetical protein [Tellurirhabdus rosea]|uniref:hypothetical protein n=1 Tax=Tellurirhabdus rosea TaxID=2674997 RepID=UPI002255F36B|nr:hypothetical protein [Tellurirhabdus rosea]
MVLLLLSGLVLLGSFFPAFGPNQSGKMAELVQHYRDHSRQTSDLSVFDFLKMHYGASSEHHKHPNHGHQQLPSIDFTAPSFLPLGTDCVLTLPAVAVLSTGKLISSYQLLYSFLSVTSLLNPPQ